MAYPLGQEPAVPQTEIPSSYPSIFRRSNLFFALWVVQLGSVALFTPLNTRLLGVGRFGQVAAAVALAQITFALGSLQLQMGIARRYDESGEDDARRLLFLSVALAIGTTAVAYLTGPLWSTALGFGRFSGAPRWAVLWAGALVLTGGSLGLLKSRQRGGPFVAVTLLQSLAGQVLAVALVLGLHRTASMFVLGLLIGQGLAALVALAFAPPKLGRRTGRGHARMALGYSLPLAPGAVAAVGLAVFDRLVLQSRMGAVAVGRFQLADTYSSLVILLLGGVNLLWLPRILAIDSIATKASSLATMRNSAFKNVVPAVIAVAVGAPVLLELSAPSSFHPDGLLVVFALLTLAALPYAGTLAYATVLLAQGQTWTLTWAMVTAAAANIDLNLVLVPQWHLAGAATASLVSYCILYVVVRWRADREFVLPRLPLPLTLSVAGGTVYVVLWSVGPTSPGWIGLRLATVGACGLWLALTRQSPTPSGVGNRQGLVLLRRPPGASGATIGPLAAPDPRPDAQPGPADHQVPRLRQRLPAGLLDSGFSSLSSFVMGLFATHYLMPKALGEYAVFYAAFFLASVVPATLIFTPIEVTALELPPDKRLSVLQKSVPLGAMTGLISGLIVSIAVIPLAAKVGMSVRIEFAATVAVLSCVSPVQDHVRRMFHQSGRSWISARVSVVQLFSVAIVVVAARVLSFPLPLVPFGALALGNLSSVIVGIVKARPKPGELQPVGRSSREVIRGGGWLTFGTVFGFAAGLASVTILTDRSGAAAAGQSEAARVLSQPVTVIVVGVLAIFGPELMSAAQKGLSGRVNKMMLGFAGVIVAATAVWLVAVGIPWPWSPIRHSFPIAYEWRGLVAWTIVQQSLAYATLGYRAVIIGNGLGNSVGKLDTITNILAVIGVYLTAPYFGPFSLIWSFLIADVLLFGVRGRMAAKSVRAARAAADE